MYGGIKHIHLLFVALSILLFELRFFLKVFNKPQARALKIIPHINDTLLLISGISLAIMAGLKPWEHSWLGFKIVALIGYIGFATMALKTNGMKSMIGYIIASALFIFMLFTAITKTPLFFNL